jgi:hypothetical protein
MAEVLPVQSADGQLAFNQPSLRRSSASYTSFFVDSTNRFSSSRKNNLSSSDLQSVALSSSQSSSSRSTTPTSSLSLETAFDDSDSDEDTITLAAYSVRYSRPSSPVKGNSRPPTSPTDNAPSPTTTTPDPVLISEDDTAVRREPSQHVDYLSHDWKEEDIWSSWRHIVSQRKVYGQRSRLENASWRTWAKSQFKLKTVSPETLNWCVPLSSPRLLPMVPIFNVQPKTNTFPG